MSAGKVYSVDDVEATLLKSSPPSLLVACSGRVVSSGWSDPELAQYVYLTPPSDGIQDFDFIASRPPAGGVVLPVLTPIRAEALLQNLDLANYWGSGLPLRGIRVHAVTNAKTAPFDKTSKMQAPVNGPAALAAPSRTADGTAAPSFQRDIKLLFRPKDVNVMAALKGWRLDVYEDVKANAADILKRLRDGDMPCDGAWPAADVDTFEKWVGTGMMA